mmetsp:Transcript_37106/g.81528  ORF Transcript_37106/g.81528 Transcript_37106/m.81528 type:complete len:506 (+) Transcript_37106:468-1985(+)
MDLEEHVDCRRIRRRALARVASDNVRLKSQAVGCTRRARKRGAHVGEEAVFAHDGQLQVLRVHEVDDRLAADDVERRVGLPPQPVACERAQRVLAEHAVGKVLARCRQLLHVQDIGARELAVAAHVTPDARDARIAVLERARARLPPMCARLQPMAQLGGLQPPPLPKRHGRVASPRHHLGRLNPRLRAARADRDQLGDEALDERHARAAHARVNRAHVHEPRASRAWVACHELEARGRVVQRALDAGPLALLEARPAACRQQRAVEYSRELEVDQTVSRCRAHAHCDRQQRAALHELHAVNLSKVHVALGRLQVGDERDRRRRIGLASHRRCDRNLECRVRMQCDESFGTRARHFFRRARKREKRAHTQPIEQAHVGEHNAVGKLQAGRQRLPCAGFEPQRLRALQLGRQRDSLHRSDHFVDNGQRDAGAHAAPESGADVRRARAERHDAVQPRDARDRRVRRNKARVGAHGVVALPDATAQPHLGTRRRVVVLASRAMHLAER